MWRGPFLYYTNEREGMEPEWEVKFVWDTGDPAVGIYAGWGEETGAWLTLGFMRVYFEFIPTDEPVEDWLIEDIQLQYIFDDSNPERNWWHLAEGMRSKYEIV